MNNIFASLPKDLSAEVFEDIVRRDSVRIERIVSRGHSSPERGWYDQDEGEWVMVLRGAARLLFEDGREVELGAGDFIDIPARTKHRVSWTDPGETTVWLAVYYK
ncbi:cupin domain-containing protein [Microbulbifer halophilus]|uniref:Cupin domain-containing protein n=1 Tax=Microbulbifer halophilus TaxID=453963 RepID=A0ABW5EEH0_9GAMM|nr:cupin domain-containing protein [Microbulbifer halophilus]MCW8127392.1 cupin domain-containing protein [Microbulbifer halophilus]